MLILNIAAGKIKPIIKETKKLKLRGDLLINLDTAYYSFLDPDDLECAVDEWRRRTDKSNIEYFCNEDAFTFMERTRLMFDRVCIYRFLEHVPMDKVLYFIYLLSTITKKGDLVDIIVPNYKLLASTLLSEDPFGSTSGNFEAHNIELTTELLNEPSCPHASIWTVDRAFYFFGIEERFKIHDYVSDFEFDGRDIYLRFFAERI